MEIEIATAQAEFQEEAELPVTEPSQLTAELAETLLPELEQPLLEEALANTFHSLSITEWRPVTGSLPPLSQEDWDSEFTKYRASPEFKQLNDRIEFAREIAKQLNNIITRDTMTIVPLVDRGRVSAASNTLGGVILNTWDSELWNAADWYRVKE